MRTTLSEFIRVLAYPLQGSVLWLNLIFSSLLYLSWKAGLFGIWLGVFVLFWVFKYAFLLLEQTAMGVREAPVLSWEDIRPLEDMRPVKLLVVCMAIYILWMGFRHAGLDVMAIVLLLVFLVLLPAQIVLLALEDDLLSLFRVPRLLGFVVAMGPAYLLLLAGMAGGILLVAWLSKRDIGLVIALIAFQYIFYLVFHWLGFVVHAQREAVGLQATHAIENLDRKIVDELDRRYAGFLSDMYALRRSGDFNHLVDRIIDFIKREGDSKELWEWFYNALGEWQDARIRALFVTPFVHYLLQKGDLLRCLEIIREMQYIDEGFRVTDPCILHDLVRGLSGLGGSREISLLLQDCEQMYLDSSVFPDLAVMALNVLSDRYAERDRCIHILEVLESRCPGMLCRPDVRRIADAVGYYGRNAS